jgi:hypothetical protein
MLLELNKLSDVYEENKRRKKDSTYVNVIPEFRVLTFLPIAAFKVLTFSHK